MSNGNGNGAKPFWATLAQDDDDDWCPLQIAFMVAFAVAMTLQAYTVVWQGHEFNVQNFGIGMGTLIGTTGAGLWANSKRLPTADEVNKNG